jgi:Ca-activated chloride channel family protein
MHFGGDSEPLKATIVDLALKHHLVTDFTSLVAVDDEVVRSADSPGHVEQAATSAPVGGAWATVGFAKTATTAPVWLCAGFVCLYLSLLLSSARFRRPAPERRPA